MKLLKIGSAASCDIVLNSDYVSAHHADLLILDDGQITIEDKGSTNGTFVGANKKRINPGVETPIRRGDLIVLGDTELQWNRVPILQSNEKFKAVYNVGTNFRNDIVLNSNVASRYHAVIKVDDKGRVFIIDNKSTNGTQINGQKIKPNTPCRIKRGDNVVCGDSDISEQIKEYIPNRFGWLKWVLGSAAAIALIVGGYFALKPGGVIVSGPKPDEMIPAVTYVFAAYHFEVSLEDSPVSVPVNFRYPAEEENDFLLQATAFFIDREGHMATNRHVALPWADEYRTDSIHDVLKQAFENYLVALVPKEVTNQSQLNILKQSDFGRALLNSSRNLNDLNAIISRIYRSKVLISGKMDYIAVGYPGRYFADIDELQRCNVICESGTEDQDVAILQLNDKKTPSEIKYVFDVNTFDTNRLMQMDKDLYTIGYPSGLQRAMDLKTKSLTPSLTVSKCSKKPSKYTFELQQDATGGSSGSPVFYGSHLVGIISGGYIGNGASSNAVQARYVKELYEKEELGKK